MEVITEYITGILAFCSWVKAPLFILPHFSSVHIFMPTLGSYYLTEDTRVADRPNSFGIMEQRFGWQWSKQTWQIFSGPSGEIKNSVGTHGCWQFNLQPRRGINTAVEMHGLTVNSAVQSLC